MSKTKEVINELLVDIFNHILEIEESELKKKGVKLSMKEVHVLEAINLVNDKTMSNVAKKLRITVGSLTISIDRLVKKCYVMRGNDENDRRRVLIGLTSKGKEVLKIHDDFHNNMLDSFIEDIDEEAQNNLISALEGVKNYFKFMY